MIEKGGIYKLKKIKGFKDENKDEFKVLEIIDGIACCVHTKTDEQFVFQTRFFIDPEKPEDDTFDLLKKIGKE